MQEKMDQWINWVEYDELLEGRHNAPHNLLGLHSFGRGQVLTVYRPEAERVFITDMSGKNELELEEIGEGSGFFGKYIPRKNYRAPYKVKVQYSENDVIEYVDHIVLNRRLVMKIYIILRRVSITRYTKNLVHIL